MHKKVILEPNYSYVQTKVPFSKSITQIKELLQQHGCDQIGDISNFKGEEPIHTLLFEHMGVPFVIQFPITYVNLKTRPPELRMAISGRIIYNRIKALLIDMELGYLSFSQAMMQYLAIPAGNEMIPLEDKIPQTINELGTREFDLTLCLKGGEENGNWNTQSDFSYNKRILGNYALHNSGIWILPSI